MDNSRFKFRAWDGEKMVVVNDIVFSGKEPIAYWKENSVIEKSSVIMQFTGLKDKNGKEIYEGDICQVMMRRKYGYQDDGVPAIVGAVEFGTIYVRDNTLFAFNTFHIKERSIQYLIGNELEIVGNVFENPELITK